MLWYNGVSKSPSLVGTQRCFLESAIRCRRNERTDVVGSREKKNYFRSAPRLCRSLSLSHSISFFFCIPFLYVHLAVAVIQQSCVWFERKSLVFCNLRFLFVCVRTLLYLGNNIHLFVVVEEIFF